MTIRQLPNSINYLCLHDKNKRTFFGYVSKLPDDLFQSRNRSSRKTKTSLLNRQVRTRPSSTKTKQHSNQARSENSTRTTQRRTTNPRYKTISRHSHTNPPRRKNNETIRPAKIHLSNTMKNKAGRTTAATQKKPVLFFNTHSSSHNPYNPA